MLINYKSKKKHENARYYKESFKINMIKLVIKCE